MTEFIKEWIINIIVLVLFIVLVEMIIPSGKTRKYINLVTGFILIIVIVNPIIKQFKNGISLESFQLADSAQLQKMEIEHDSSLYNKEQMKQITEVYRQKVIKQLEKSAKETEGVADAKADVIINEDYNSDNFGEIKRAYINITPKGSGSSEKPVGSVKRVRVEIVDKVGISTKDGQEGMAGSGNRADKAGKDDTQVDAKVRRSIEDKVGKLFNIDAKNVVIGLMN